MCAHPNAHPLCWMKREEYERKREWGRQSLKKVWKTSEEKKRRDERHKRKLGSTVMLESEYVRMNCVYVRVYAFRHNTPLTEYIHGVLAFQYYGILEHSDSSNTPESVFEFKCKCELLKVCVFTTRLCRGQSLMLSLYSLFKLRLLLLYSYSRVIVMEIRIIIMIQRSK